MGQVDSIGQRTEATSLSSPLAVAAFAALLSLALRLPTLGELPAFFDEVITLRTLALDPLELMAERIERMHSPTYYWLLQALGLDGSSPLFLLRLPSAVADSLGAALTALVAYRLGGFRAGLALAVLYAGMPVMLEEAQDARPNGCLFGFLALLLWSAARLLEHPHLAAAAWRRSASAAARRLRWTWVAHVLATVLLVNMLPLGLFAVLAVDAAMLWLHRRKERRFLIRPWLLHRAVSLVLLAPLLYGYSQKVGRYVGHYWYSDSWKRLLQVWEGSAGAGVGYDPNYFLGELGNLALTVLFLTLVLLGILWGRRRASFTLLLSLAFFTQALLIAISQHTSLYVVRYFGIATPALTVLAALGFAGLWQRSARLAGLVGPTVATLLFLQALDAMHQLNKPRFDLAVNRLRESGVDHLALYVRDNFLYSSVRYYLSDNPKGEREKHQFLA
ncbi:MAG TPA: hypothetical protein VJL84_03235, partial [Kiloniellales bacterium]|nr:hypothetical protein [Kiloniellales bacterium]